MLIIGLTGTIASGKSTIADVMRRHHIPIFDADKAVHKLMGPKGKAVGAVVAEFGESVILSGGIDRKALGAFVFGNDAALRRLESILHPQVAEERMRFIKQARMMRRSAVVLDVPLLFETGTDALCDVTMMAWAPLRLIQQRALVRPHMTAAKLEAVLAKQMPQFEKSKLADEKIATGLGYAAMTRQIHRLLWKWQLR